MTRRAVILTTAMALVLSGRGRLRYGDQTYDIQPNDIMAFPAGDRKTAHQITNTGTEVLKFLCCCAPGYEDEDTVLLD